MKLLFDQNISPRILRYFQKGFPSFQYVCFVNLEDVDDGMIFKFAKDNDFTIVTLDSDFILLNEIFGAPSKIIWLRTGNRSTLSTFTILKDNFIAIKDFMQQPQGVLEIRK